MHKEQTVALPVENEPVGQGTGAAAMRGQNVPAGHGVQATSPAAAKEPLLHVRITPLGVHTLPLEQFKQAVELPVEYVPTLQFTGKTDAG